MTTKTERQLRKAREIIEAVRVTKGDLATKPKRCPVCDFEPQHLNNYIDKKLKELEEIK